MVINSINNRDLTHILHGLVPETDDIWVQFPSTSTDFRTLLKAAPVRVGDVRTEGCWRHSRQDQIDLE